MTAVQSIVRGKKVTMFPHRGMMVDNDLLIADLHLGKVNHFRKAGVPVPEKANNENIERLIDLIGLSDPERVILMGDLFHSHYNSEWEVFRQVVSHFAGIEFHLVEGNHDIMSSYQYEKISLQLHESLTIGPFTLTHIPMDPEALTKDQYNLAGHIHPAVSLRGKGRQSVQLPCFYFGRNQGFLPAFGNFTGTSRVRLNEDDQVFIIASNKVIRKN